MIRRFVQWYGSQATHLVMPYGLLLAVIAVAVDRERGLPGGWWTVLAALVLPKALWVACATLRRVGDVAVPRGEPTQQPSSLPHSDEDRTRAPRAAR